MPPQKILKFKVAEMPFPAFSMGIFLQSYDRFNLPLCSLRLHEHAALDFLSRATRHPSVTDPVEPDPVDYFPLPSN